MPIRPARLGESLPQQILAELSSQSRMVATVVALTMVVFLFLDGAVVSSCGNPVAVEALPWLRATRLAAIATCLLLLGFDWRQRHRPLRVEWALAGQTALLSVLFFQMAALLGFYHWFQPTSGFYVAAVFFLGLTLRLPLHQVLSVFGAGLVGIALPLLLGPLARPAEQASDLVNLTLMTAVGVAAAHLGYRRRCKAYADDRTIAGQRDALQLALLQAEQLRAEAQAAGNAKTSFLAQMSHEIRTPLHGIIGMTELALSDDIHPETHDHLSLAHKSAVGLLGIVNDILEYSRLSASEPALDVAPLDLTALLHELTASFAPVAAKRGAGLELRCAGVPPWLQGDVGRLRQILSNLIDNALKFSSGGDVRLQCTAELTGERSCALHIEVCDTGIGIPADRLAAIFTPFEQADLTVAHRYGGTGLGLAITARLVHAMGGQIAVQSQVGKGSCFAVDLSLPLATAPAERPQVEPPASAAVCWRVLVAEDNAVNQQIARISLQKAGHSVHMVASGREALDAIAREKFDAVLMDVQMPDMDGFEATRRVREAEAGGSTRLPIVAVTAHATPEYRDTIRDSGFDAYLAKPFKSGDLAEVLMRVVVRAPAQAATPSSP